MTPDATEAGFEPRALATFILALLTQSVFGTATNVVRTDEMTYGMKYCSHLT